LRLNARGFNLIELMVVVAVLGVLFAIAIPNYYDMKARAEEATAEANMYDLQIAVIHYSVDTGGIYPTPADEAALRAFMPHDEYPENPFTDTPQPWVWGPPAGGPGTIGNAQPASGYQRGYEIWGMGRAGVLPLHLISE
jgi:prepilin-type N-terminal cleavage/methylation domain-containing protein